jgi:hypothetical protein
MNIQITQTQCNSCKSIIPTPNANGAVRLAGTTIDFCAQCAEKAVSFVATTFTMPTAPRPALQKVRLANGAVTMLPINAPLPQGAIVVTSDK